MYLRAALILFVLAFIGLLIVLGAASFIRWLKIAHPRLFRPVLGALCVALVGVVIVGYMEAVDQPVFRPGDLITLGQPIVARPVERERLAPAASCIVEIRERLSVVDIGGGTLKARVESNRTSGPGLCPVGTEVEFDLAWLNRYTLTHR